MFGRKKAKLEKEKSAAASAKPEAADASDDTGLHQPAPAGDSMEAPSLPAEKAGSQDPSNRAGQAPPLYQRPVPLSSEAHGSWHLRQDRDFGFAAGAALVPLNAAEFPLASRHYPVVFGTQGQIALAVLGSAGGNSFVGQDGKWRPGTYVPAYIRRYPFLFMAAPDDKFVLSIDEAYEAFGDSGDPLFNNGEASEITKSALAFCQVFEREIGATSAFIMALEQAGLLSVDLPSFDRLGGRKLTVKGVRAIDRASFDALPDATFIE